MKNINLLEVYAKANYSDRQQLERILGKETFKKLDYYEILSYHLPERATATSKHIQKASCFTEPQFGGSSAWSIYSIKRLYDGKIFTIGDYLKFSKDSDSKGTLLEIQFEIAPADKGTKRLCFVNDHKTFGKWSQVSNLEHTTKPLFMTDDDCEVSVGGEYYIVNNEYQLVTLNGKPFIANEGTTRNKGEMYFYDKGNALDYIKLYHLLQPIESILIKQTYPCFVELVKSKIKQR